MLFCVVLLAGAPFSTQAATATCPTTATEAGGTYCAFNEGQTNLVHVWRPESYNPQTAAVVIYAHGNTKNEETDGTWKRQNLADTFKNSGINALFVAPRGSSCSSGCNNTVDPWSNLNQLLSSVSREAGINIPSGPIVVVSHSGGYRASHKWLSDPRVKGYIGLETVYGREAVFASWPQASNDHRIILVSSSSVGGTSTTGNTGVRERNKRIVSSVEPHVIKDEDTSPGNLTEEERKARGIHLKVSQSHGQLPTVLTPALLPIVLQTSGGGGAAVAQTGVPGDFKLTKPNLNVPIPGVTFGDGTAGEDSIGVPFIAEYIQGIYIYLVGAAATIAILMLMIGGLQYVFGAGSATQITKGKERIRNAIVGLVLLLSTVVILTTVNPTLTELNNVELLYINQVPTEVSADISFATEVASRGKLQAVCDKTSCKEFCDKDPTGTDASVWGTSSPGMMRLDETVPIENTAGVFATRRGQQIRTGKETARLLQKAGELISSKNPNYRIRVVDGYRTLAGQAKLACNKVRAGKADQIGRNVARPGTSKHGVGYAVDIYLEEKLSSGVYKALTENTITVAAQNDRRWTEGSKILTNIMDEAGFHRYTAEMWHFEPKSVTGLPCRCSGNDCPHPPQIPPTNNCGSY